MSRSKILLPCSVDESNSNAQCINAKEFLSRWSNNLDVISFNHDAPDARVASQANVQLKQLWPWRFWGLSVFLNYQANVDGIFYAQHDPAQVLGLKLRDISRRSVPLVVTCEGLMGDKVQELEYSQWAGHPVFCQRSNLKNGLKWHEWLFSKADHIIAISPFLSRMTRKRFGDKVSTLPLGIDLSIFHKGKTQENRQDIVVVSVGRVAPHKRPGIFLKLARKYPEVMFKWFGEGESRQQMLQEARRRRLGNLEFPGPVAPSHLAQQFRKADIFVLPSKSEGVPKVTQEAAACGLPVILYGFYESPTVVHEKNGFVVWDDEDFSRRVGELINDPDMRLRMGRAGIQMARDWDWDKVAPLWEATICELLGVTER